MSFAHRVFTQEIRLHARLTARKNSKTSPSALSFRSHQFRERPNLGNSEGHWRLVRLELVSLLKFTTPKVYASTKLPNMRQLRNSGVPTRSLDDFEQTALDKLLNGENIVIQTNSKHIEMLGAVRAVDQCLKCHQVEYGQLLGAFSYTLYPKR